MCFPLNLNIDGLKINEQSTPHLALDDLIVYLIQIQ